jgi:hypothetical protein
MGMSSREEKKVVRDALENRGVVQEMGIVEVDVEEILRYLRESRVPDLGGFWLYMEDLERFGEILW